MEPRTARRLARATDPATSHKAAKKVKEFSRTHEQRILGVFKTYGEMTYTEIAMVTGLEPHAVARRLRAMADDKRIMDTGMARKLPSGRWGTVWAARENG
jgi:hypothetical protein